VACVVYGIAFPATIGKGRLKKMATPANRGAGESPSENRRCAEIHIHCFTTHKKGREVSPGPMRSMDAD